jgi:hypothetical protein
LCDFKQQAEALRVGLLAGYVSPLEVVEWADGIIATGDVPGPELIEVSLGGSMSVAALAAALGTIPGEVSPAPLAQAILRQMAVAFRRDPTTGPGIARCLFQMSLGGLIPSPEAEAQMSRLDDAFHLAESGTWGTLPAVQAELAEFLAEWAQ